MSLQRGGGSAGHFSVVFQDLRPVLQAEREPAVHRVHLSYVERQWRGEPTQCIPIEGVEPLQDLSRVGLSLGPRPPALTASANSTPDAQSPRSVPSQSLALVRSPG